MSLVSSIRSLSLLLLLTACGFQPVYADRNFRFDDGKNIESSLQKVRILPLADRNGQQLQNMLIDRMYLNGYPQNPPYTLEIDLDSEERDLGIQQDATATRTDLYMTATMILRQTQGHSELYRSKARIRVSYNILDAQYGTLVARENATKRGLTQLADEIVNRISLYFNRDEPVGSTPAGALDSAGPTSTTIPNPKQ